MVFRANIEPVKQRYWSKRYNCTRKLRYHQKQDHHFTFQRVPWRDKSTAKINNQQIQNHCLWFFPTSAPLNIPEGWHIHKVTTTTPSIWASTTDHHQRTDNDNMRWRLSALNCFQTGGNKEMQHTPPGIWPEITNRNFFNRLFIQILKAQFGK